MLKESSSLRHKEKAKLRFELSSLPLDTKSISQDSLNIEARERMNLFPWNGQFSPQLIEVLLKTFTSRGQCVLDPFAGSGTVLAEAGRLGNAAFGTEINPAAYKFAKTYELINAPHDARATILSHLERLLADLLTGDLFSHQRSGEELQNALSEKMRSISDEQTRNLFEGFLLLLDYKYRAFDTARLRVVWNRFKMTIVNLPYSPARIEAAHADARSLPLPGQSVDFVVTSPPYINVFNYHQQYRASAESLGWNLLSIAQSEIGSNRKHRKNRFLTVTQYILDMELALKELMRVCKPNARIVLVMGRESNVRKTKFLNGEIMANIGVRCLGLKIDRRQERVFRNRFGLNIFEDIIHFINAPGSLATDPYTIAEEALLQAKAYAPQESLSDLNAALQDLRAVRPSPLCVPKEATSLTK